MFHPQGPTFFELAQQALSSTERGYDLLAPKFEYTPFRTPDPIIRTAIEELGKAGPVDRGLDLCCGTGAALSEMRRISRTAVGIDFSRGMLGVARQHLEAEPSPAAVHFIRGEVLQMPFFEVFDLAVCFGALGHILPRDQDRFASQVHQALQPGGRFALVTEPMPSLVSLRYWLARGFNAAMHVRNVLIRPPFIMFYLTWSLQESQDVLQRAGFEVEVIEGLWSGRWQELCLVVATKPESNPRPGERVGR